MRILYFQGVCARPVAFFLSACVYFVSVNWFVGRRGRHIITQKVEEATGTEVFPVPLPWMERQSKAV